MANQDYFKITRVKDANLKELLEVLNLYLDQILDRDKNNKYIKDFGSVNTLSQRAFSDQEIDFILDREENDRYWLSIDKLYELFKIRKSLDLPELNLGKTTTIISKREMLSMVSAFYKQFGPEINTRYLSCILNRIDSNQSTYMYNSNDGDIVFEQCQDPIVKGQPEVDGKNERYVLELPAFHDFNETDIYAMDEILNPNEQYATPVDSITMAHEVGHMVYRPKNGTKYNSASRELWETNAILMETLFEDFVIENYPEFEQYMDRFSYDRCFSSLNHMDTVFTVVYLALMKREKGASLDYQDLIQFSNDTDFGIIFDSKNGVETVENNVRSVTFVNEEELRKTKVRALVDAYFKPLIVNGIYVPWNKKILKLEDEFKLASYANNISFRVEEGYALGSLLVPSIRQAFYDCDREEAIEKLKKYFKLFENNQPDEALKVFGIDIDSKEGIDEIYGDYLDFLDEITDRVGVEIIYNPPEDEIEEEEKPEETNEEIMSRLSDDDGTPHFDDYEIPDEKYARDDEDDGR